MLWRLLDSSFFLAASSETSFLCRNRWSGICPGGGLINSPLYRKHSCWLYWVLLPHEHYSDVLSWSLVRFSLLESIFSYYVSLLAYTTHQASPVHVCLLMPIRTTWHDVGFPPNWTNTSPITYLDSSCTLLVLLIQDPVVLPYNLLI